MVNIPASLLQRFSDSDRWVREVGRNLVIPQPLAPPPGPGISFIHGKIDSTIEAGGSGTLSRYWLDNSGVEVDSGQDFTVYDWHGCGYVEGDQVHARRDLTSTNNSGKWYLDKPLAHTWAGKGNADTTGINGTSVSFSSVLGLDVEIDPRGPIWKLEPSDDTIQINKTGQFQFLWSGNWEMSQSNRHFHAFLEENAGLGFIPVEYPTIRAWEHGSAAGSPAHAFMGAAKVVVTSGNLYRVSAFVSSGTATVSAEIAYEEDALIISEII